MEHFKCIDALWSIWSTLFTLKNGLWLEITTIPRNTRLISFLFTIKTSGVVGEQTRGADTGGPGHSCEGGQSGQPGLRGDQPPPATPLRFLVLQQWSKKIKIANREETFCGRITFLPLGKMKLNSSLFSFSCKCEWVEAESVIVIAK